MTISQNFASLFPISPIIKPIFLPVLANFCQSSRLAVGSLVKGLMRKSGLAEKYVRIVQDMYDGSTTAVRCAVGVTEGFDVKVGLHQGSALSPCLFAMDDG